MKNPGEATGAGPTGTATEAGEHDPSADDSGLSAAQRIADRQLHFDVFVDPAAETASVPDSSVREYPKGGDTWCRIHQGDAFHLIEQIDDASVDLIITRWVNIGDTYFARWASIRDDGRQGLGNNARIRRRTPMGSYLQEKQLLLVPARFAIAMENERWILRNDMIWFKPNVPPRPENGEG